MNGWDEERALIPGLPDDIALDCIARVPHRFHPVICAVSRRWRDLVTASAFRLHRHRIGVAEDLILLIQAQPGGLSGAGRSKDEFRPPPCRLVAYNASMGEWRRAVGAVPVFARVTVVKGRVVVIGGWDPETLKPVGEVRVVDPVTGGWRPGKAMREARSFFGCGVAGGRVYVAGGHDSQKNALKTAEAYDVEDDEWVELPEMGEERDECQGLGVGGRFWAVSGYGTEGQGRFDPAAECYDPATGRWTKIEGVCEEIGGGDGPGSGIYAAAGERVRYVDGRGVREYGRGWREVGKGPEGMRAVAVAVEIGEETVFVTGVAEGGGMVGWVLEDGKWMRVSNPIGFSGSVYSAAVIRV
ncbi:F-box/kelch-repeat protein At2g44130-like [Dioscorea cayenensis subsp. rotundata]|uniref:F-box/kelch-repeat protein At2g44130-like n=1 Tax=Dioscorea cayennensis subsp. rotundata TaxID=55577 RepID=A0AB40BFX0_DIOCR|nr:F-box/kelch-repeat protein At2g44130-like [Dioscorea cayenensis subsp. rotundata]